MVNSFFNKMNYCLYLLHVPDPNTYLLGLLSSVYSLALFGSLLPEGCGPPFHAYFSPLIILIDSDLTPFLVIYLWCLVATLFDPPRLLISEALRFSSAASLEWKLRHASGLLGSGTAGSVEYQQSVPLHLRIRDDY